MSAEWYLRADPASARAPSPPRRPRRRMVGLTRRRTSPSGTDNPCGPSCHRDPGSSRQSPCARATRRTGRGARGTGRQLLLAHSALCSRYTVIWESDVLDVERPLEARGEKAAERGDQRGERGEDDGVQLERRPRDRRDLAAELCVRVRARSEREGRKRGGRGGSGRGGRLESAPTTTTRRRRENARRARACA